MKTKLLVTLCVLAMASVSFGEIITFDLKVRILLAWATVRDPAASSKGMPHQVAIL
jgi:hypothetical protein